MNTSLPSGHADQRRWAVESAVAYLIFSGRRLTGMPYSRNVLNWQKDPSDAILCLLKDVIRGATYDLLDDRPFEEFAKLPSDAYAFLNANDRAAAQAAVLRWV